jgi:protein TonB
MPNAVMTFERKETVPLTAAVPASVITPSPLDRQPARTRVPMMVGGLGAAVVHASAAMLALGLSQMPREQSKAMLAAVTQMIEVELPQVEAPPATLAPEPAPEPELTPEPETPRMRAPKAVVAPPPELPQEAKPAAPSEEPPPAAAQTAAALVAQPEAAPVAADNALVVGTAAAFVGGTSASRGTAIKPVTDRNASALGVEGGRGTAPVTVDRSRAPMLAGGARWDCPFPEEADDAGVDQATVSLRVRVDAQGKVASVDVAQDPGNGFGREARRCALRKAWQAGLDRSGQAVAAQSLVNVRFVR